MDVLLTGSTGFLGSAIVRQLSQQSDVQITALVRPASRDLAENIVRFEVAGLSRSTDYSEALVGMDVVIHAAARVHVMHDDASDPLAEFREVNVEGTLNLARQAAAQGVKRFVFISSIKVNGEGTTHQLPFSPDDTYVTSDPYGLSKREAEQGLLALAEETGIEVVVIRPPLIYGPGVKANFRRLIRWLDRGIPLPLGAVHNQRSLVALDNLVDFILCCTDHPKAANQIFLISDQKDVSTTELLHKVAKALEKRAWLVPVPVSWMSFVAGLLGKKDVADRLLGSLQMDSSKATELLGWKPVVTMDEQLKMTVEAYRNETRR